MQSVMYSEDFDPGRPAYVMANTGLTVSYEELEAVSNQIAHLFRNSGLQRGDSIALCLENHHAFLPICWAAHRSGIYFTAISYRLQAQEVEYIVNDCGAKILITSAHLEDTFKGFKDNLANKPTCYICLLYTSDAADE